MPSRPHIDIRLDERRPDRVFATVELAPGAEPVRVDGAAVELFSATGESLSTRVLLPIHGILAHPLVTRVEVRSRGAIPPESELRALVWTEVGEREARCPADPWTELQSHLRGSRVARVRDRCGALEPLDRMARAVLARRCRFAWLAPAMAAAEVLDPEPEPRRDNRDLADEACAAYELDDENAAFLRDLLCEDD